MHYRLCLSQRSITVKSQYDHRNSYKRKHVIGVCLLLEALSLLWHGAWWLTSREDARAIAEHSTSGSTGSRKRERDSGPGLSIWNLKFTPPPQWYTSSYKAMPTNRLIVLLPLGLWGPFSFTPPQYPDVCSECMAMHVPPSVQCLLFGASFLQCGSLR